MRAQIELRERIIGGKVAPGTRLMEVALAEDLGISRTPVREAMARLAEEGLLERVRSGGFRVRAFSVADVIDAIELRGVLEGTAARRAAERGLSDGELSRLHGFVVDLDAVFANDTFDFGAYSESNTAFHTALWEASGSDVIRREAARIAALPFAAPSAFTADTPGMASFRTMLIGAQEQHRQIVEAIAAREGARAEALAREHAHTALRSVDYHLKRHDGAPGLRLVEQRTVS